MRQFLLERERSGSWRLYAPPAAGRGISLLGFGDAAWDATAARWSRPDANDYENAERVRGIIRGTTDPCVTRTNFPSGE